MMQAVKQEIKEQWNSDRFASEGAAWQWVLDNTQLLPEQIMQLAGKTGLSAFGVIDTVKICYDKGQTVDEAIKQLAAIGEQHSVDLATEYKRLSAGYNLQAFVNGIADSANTPAIKTGFVELDNALDGGLYEGLYIFGAVTSLGKTTFVLQLADSVALRGNDVLIISLEMARSELMAKSISRLTADLVITNDKYGKTCYPKTARGITDGARYASYTELEKELIKDAVNAYGQFAERVYIREGNGDISVKEVRAAVEQHKKITGNMPVVIVDYIQILYPYDIKANEKVNTDRAITELKRISRDYKTPVIGISSYNRAKYNEKADLAAFKESGGIEYGSDVLISLQYTGVGEKEFKIDAARQAEPRKVELVILKNRNGQVGKVLPFDYYPKYNRFRERCK